MTRVAGVRAVAVAALLVLVPEAARAQVLYGITWGNELITINTTTGAGTLATPIVSPISPFGLAFRGNNLYAYDEVTKTMRQLDPATGATLATIAVGINAIGEGDLVFRSDGMGFMSDASGGTGQLWRFDVTVPSSTAITAAAGFSPSMDGLAFNGADVLYGLDQGGTALYTINQATGATTLVGNTGIPGAFILGGLAFDSSGNLFAVLSNIGGASSLYRINTTTGAGTLVGNIGFNSVSGLRFPGTITSPPSTPPTGNEGSYSGSSGGQTGAEGGFGFGGRWPALLGPFGGGAPGNVLNISHRPPRPMKGAAHAAAEEGPGVSNWILALGIASVLLAALVAIKRV